MGISENKDFLITLLTSFKSFDMGDKIVDSNLINF